MDKYQEFLASKQIIHPDAGIDFPKKKLSRKLFPFQRDIVAWALRKGRAAIFADCGLGKGQPVGSLILTPSGFTENQKLRIGDKVIWSSGYECNVLGVYHKPPQPTWRVHFSDGCSLVVDEDHLHLVRTNNDRQRTNRWRVMSTRELLECGNLRYGKDGQSRNYDIPVVGFVNYAHLQELPINAYLLGVILGDGGISGRVVNISSADEGILQAVRDVLPDGLFLNKKSKYDHCVSLIDRGGRYCHNPIAVALDLYGLMGLTSDRKYIPEPYLRASINDRIELLQGLMDTDGYIADSGSCEFSTTSPMLCNGIVELIRSLGGIPIVGIKEKPQYTHKGEKRTGKRAYRVVFSLATCNPFKLHRKAIKWNCQPRDNGRWIDRIEFEKVQPTICIAVDSPDHSYVTENFAVTHNTIMQVEWMRRIGGNGLILAPLAVNGQTVNEAQEKLHVSIFNARAECEAQDVITNYEMMHHFNPSRYRSIVLDESSILKAFDGKTRNDIITRFCPVPYRLACTAQPSPNDIMELGNHSEFLGNLSRTEMLSTFFVHDGGDTSKWRLKGHAEKQFWQWVCQWAVMLRKPSDLGYSDEGYILPELRMHEIVVDCDDKAIIEDDVSGQWTMFPGSAKTLSERRAARSGTTEERAAAMAQIHSLSPEDQWLFWCNLNKESETLSRLIPRATEVTGSDTRDFKEKAMMDFALGKGDLVTKPDIAGWGMNWQNCHKVGFLGLSDSFESFYQALRRVWRFGQQYPVDAYIVISSLEGEVLKNIKRKQAQADKMAEEMVKNMSELNKAEIKGNKRQGDEYKPETVCSANWEMSLMDNVEWSKKQADDSIHYMMSSWPFASLYTYSASERDMGNCRTHAEFWEHMGFLIPEMLRILKPGRLMSVHCMDLPTSKERDGYIGITDFSGEVVRQCKAAGFIYHSRVTIWKDPVTAMQRTKALGLLHKQVKKDSCMSRQGIPDFLLTFRKPGINIEPVDGLFEEFIGEDSREEFEAWCRKEYARKGGHMSFEEFRSVAIWQRYASPVWADINPSDTLQKQSAREDEDERHICPLQLQVIERGIELWSNPGDVVADLFAGIGSTGYKAIKMGRQFKGCDLKRSYFLQSVGNLRAAEIIQGNLFAATQELSPTLDEAV